VGDIGGGEGDAPTPTPRVAADDRPESSQSSRGDDARGACEGAAEDGSSAESRAAARGTAVVPRRVEREVRPSRSIPVASARRDPSDFGSTFEKRANIVERSLVPPRQERPASTSPDRANAVAGRSARADIAETLAMTRS